MSRWYRAYEGTVTDAKLGEAALVAGCSRSVAIAAWHCILESCASAQRGGEYDTSPRRVAVILGEPLAALTALFEAFTELAMIGNGTVTAWKQRQFESDTSTERSRKHRQRKSNGDATLQQQDEPLPEHDATPPYTDTDTDTEAEREKDARAQDDPSHWKVVGDILKDHAKQVDDWELDFLHSIKWASSLTKPQADSLKAIQGKLSFKGGSGPPPPKRVIVRENSPAWEAWKRTGRRFSAMDLKDERGFVVARGWYFESEFPPQEKAA